MRQQRLVIDVLEWLRWVLCWLTVLAGAIGGAGFYFNFMNGVDLRLCFLVYFALVGAVFARIAVKLVSDLVALYLWFRLRR